MKTTRTLLSILALLLAPMARSSAAPGDLDPLNANIVGDFVQATAVQPDGKIIIGGQFHSVMGVPRSNIARLNADGTLDMGFDPKANKSVISVAIQADGKVLLGGYFTTLQPNGAPSPTTRNSIARVNADGTLDMGFNPNATYSVWALAVQADGKVLLGGNITALFSPLEPNGPPVQTPRNNIARVNADGTLDLTFNPNANSIVLSLAVQPDGKVLLGGWFTTLQPNGAPAATARQYIARVNPDGTLDPGFDPKASNWVQCMAVQPDGKVLLGGRFTTLQPNGAASPTTRNRIARVNADGTLDPGFDPNTDSSMESIAVQADGRVLLGGGFSRLQPNGAASYTLRNSIARVNADGTLGAGFDPRAGCVYGVAIQANGKVLLGGYFTTLQPNGAASPTPRNLFARLENDVAIQTITTPNATQILWTRGGTAPEISRATFELSTNGGASWSPLGTPTRVGTTANWQLTGLALPATGSLRARGVTSGGQSNASQGLIEQVSPFDTTPYGQWKLAQLGAVNAPDTGDPDGDAYLNLAEYGLVLSPTAFSTGPVGERFSYPEGDRLRMVFTRDTARNDVTIEVLAADDLAGLWTPIASSVLGAVTTGAGYYSGDSAGPGLKTVEVRDLYNVDDPAHPRRFLRLRVSH